MLFGYSRQHAQAVIILGVGAYGTAGMAQAFSAFSELREDTDAAATTAMCGLAEELLGLKDSLDVHQATQVLVARAHAATYPLVHLGREPRLRSARRRLLRRWDQRRRRPLPAQRRDLRPHRGAARGRHRRGGRGRGGGRPRAPPLPAWRSPPGGAAHPIIALRHRRRRPHRRPSLPLCHARTAWCASPSRPPPPAVGRRPLATTTPVPAAQRTPRPACRRARRRSSQTSPSRCAGSLDEVCRLRCCRFAAPTDYLGGLRVHRGHAPRAGVGGPPCAVRRLGVRTPH
jgi:hypothetical protein